MIVIWLKLLCLFVGGVAGISVGLKVIRGAAVKVALLIFLVGSIVGFAFLQGWI